MSAFFPLLRAASILLLIGLGSRAAALAPPVGLPQRGDVAIGVGDSESSTPAMVLVDGYPHVIQGSAATPLEYTWFDGLIWRSQRISDERLHQAEAVRVGDTLHVVALLSEGDAAPQLHYLALPLRSGVPSRRDVIAANPGPGFALSLNASGTAPILLYQRADRSAWWVTGLGSALNIARATDLDNHAELVVHDMVGGRAALWVVFESIVPGVGQKKVQVLADPASGPSFEEVVPFNVGNASYVARIALSNDASPLVAMATDVQSDGSSTQHRWLRRTGGGQWTCPAASPDPGGCRLVPSADSSHVVTSRIALASDTGGGYVALLAGRLVENPDPTQQNFRSVWSRRLFSDGRTEDTLHATGTSRAFAIATAPPFFDTVLFQAFKDNTTTNALYAGMSSETPWRTYAGNGNTIYYGLSLSADPAGEPVVVADGGPGAGLVRSRWNTTQGRQLLQSLRPVDERYVESKAAFDTRGNLHVVARAVSSGSLYYLRAEPGAQAQRELLDAQGGQDAGIEIAVDTDGTVFASWYQGATGSIRIAQRHPVDGAWTSRQLSGNWTSSARPQLALSRTGLVFLSVHDDITRRIRVLQRATDEPDAPFAPALETLPIVSQPVHDLAGARDGRPVLAYVRQDQPEEPQWLAYRFITGQASEPQVVDISLPHSVPSLTPVRALRLALVDDSPSDARVLAAYAESPITGNRLIYGRRTAVTPDAAFEVTDLGPAPDTEISTGLGLVTGPVATYVAAAENQQLILARHGDPGLHDEQLARGERLAPILNEASAPDDVTRLPAWYAHLLAICYCLTQPCNDWDLGGVGRTDARGQGNPAAVDLSHELRLRFSTTPAGLRYLSLWLEHGDEMGEMVMQDPDFAARRLTVFTLFLPGLIAFVEGDGSQVRMSSEMLEAAAEIWRHFADHGSPALRAAIEAELDRTDDLQHFADMSFEQWFAALPSEPSLFADGFEAE